MRRDSRGGRAAGARNPFEVLGLDPGAALTEDEVRAAWRRIAAATHPDRSDGGDPERFAAAAAAYTDLRTAFGRGEARAELAARARGRIRPKWRGVTAGADSPGPASTGEDAARVPVRSGVLGRAIAGYQGRIRNGRPGRLALRIAAGAAAATAAVLAAWPRPAAAALVTGVLTWLLLTARQDLARPPGPGRSVPPPGRTVPPPVRRRGPHAQP